MISGFDTALGEITLVLFTTLAPSGAMAFLIMGLPALLGKATAAEFARINKFLCLPLVVSMVGLIASATHLGSPANALYVFANIGSSPLSNEVLLAVVFLTLAGLYWLYSFSQRPRTTLMRLWLGAIDVAALAFVVAVALAYSSRTIISWNIWEAPASVLCNALVGGPLLALCGYCFGGCIALAQAQSKALIAVSGASLAANTVVYTLQLAATTPVGNAIASVAELVPAYPFALGAFTMLGVASLAVAARGTRSLSALGNAADPDDRGSSNANGTDDQGTFTNATAAGTTSQAAARLLGLAVVLSLAGIFIMRFCFYMSHLTVGLGV